MPPPPQEPPEESAAALPGADNPLCRPYDDPATRLNSEGNSSSPKSLQIVSREHPSSFSTCDAVDDNRFSTSAFCHAYLHPIALWRRGPGVVAKDYITQSGIFQLCGFALAYVAADDWRRSRRWRAFILAGLALLFFANIIYLASGRTELVLTPIFILLLGFRLSGWRGLIAGLVAGMVLAGIAWTSSAYMRGQLTSLITIWNTPDYTRAQLTNLIKGSKLDPGDVALASAGLRLEYYRKSIAVIMNAPIMGHGTGKIRARFEDVAAGETGVAGITTGNPHQQTFAVAIQLGLVGAALLCAMWITHLLLFRGAGVVPWLGLLVVVQNILGSSLNSNLFDFTQGWIYVFGVGVLGGAVLRGIPDQMNTATSARNDL